MEIKANNYYLDMDRHLVYVVGRKKWPKNTFGRMQEDEGKPNDRGWEFICLTTNKTWHLDQETLEIIFVQDLGPTIAPAMRLLYGAANV